jgi:selenocysteine-specific elongation factor
MPHVVVGTAGHIDHGKSSLVLALTGTDPDRLREEKARGITIDLGFAHLTQGDTELSFVDVPGHERFVRNMLAGVGGTDLVMLHVAADEAVMPQTREHFEICRLLGVPAGLVAITKSDLADPATLDVVRLEIEELVSGSFLEGAPVLPVSARTGEGLDALRRALVSLAGGARRRSPEGPPRLPVDRVFTMKGFGTVVTGTLLTGCLEQDQDLLLQPSGRPAKVRGLQVHGEGRMRADAGQRVAVNLAGVDRADVGRGETLTVEEAVTVTRRADVHLELLGSARSLKHGARVRFHQGTRELLGRIVLPQATQVEPGTVTVARLHLEAPAVLVRGDRFILRAYSPLATIAGGTVLDPAPPRRGVRTAAGLARFDRLRPGAGHAEAVMAMVEEAGLAGLPVPRVIGRAGVPWPLREEVQAGLEASGRAVLVGDCLVSASHLGSARRHVLTLVEQHHVAHPLEDGIPREELRERVLAGAATAVFEELLRRLVEEQAIVARDRVALAGHRLALSEEETRVRAAVAGALEAAGLAPPDPAAVAGAVGASPAVVDRMLALLVRQDVLARAGDLVFHATALHRLRDEIHALKAAGTDLIDVSTFKTRYQVTRKHAIPLLEYLDRERITRRVGDKRRIL